MPTKAADAQPRSVSAADANRNFSKLLREVRGGQSYVVTSHGRPVAELKPYEGPSAELIVSRRAHLDSLRSQPAVNIQPWTREEIYQEVLKGAAGD